ncbi:MAG: hypothetical protein AAFR97_16525, partial [Bacteroidota bacterium]
LERAMNTHELVSGILDRIIAETDADYAQVVAIHNGGGRIEATTPLYMSIVAEEVRPGIERMRPDMQRVEVLPSYRRMVGWLLRDRLVFSPTNEIEDRTLSGILTLMSAHYAAAGLLRTSAKEVLLLRITTHNQEGFSQAEEIIVRQCIAGLKKCYN